MDDKSRLSNETEKDKSRNAVVFTIGHSNKDIRTFLDLLRSVKVQTVVDCRTRPRSRFPHFNDEALATYLAVESICYEWRGHNLGGLAGNVRYEETIDEMKARAESGERIALLCSEGDPKKCHRGTLLAPCLSEIGVEVEHLRYEAKESKDGQLGFSW